MDDCLSLSLESEHEANSRLAIESCKCVLRLRKGACDEIETITVGIKNSREVNAFCAMV